VLRRLLARHRRAFNMVFEVIGGSYVL